VTLVKFPLEAFDVINTMIAMAIMIEGVVNILLVIAFVQPIGMD